MLAPGEMLGGYRIVGVLSSSTSGAVYSARRLSDGRPVALKVAHADDAELWLRRYQLEAHITASIGDPHLVYVYECGIAAGSPFLASELIAGGSLEGWIAARRGGLDQAAILHVARELASALDAVHRSGFLHRDVKPANVLIGGPGPSLPPVYLSDFGVAHETGRDPYWAQGSFVGTFEFMAPEVPYGEATQAADIYSLGCVVFELMTGVPPFAATGFDAIVAHASEPPRRVADLRPELAAADPVLQRVLAAVPRARYGSCGHFVAALEATAGEWNRSHPTEVPAAVAQPQATRPRVMQGRDEGVARFLYSDRVLPHLLAERAVAGNWGEPATGSSTTQPVDCTIFAPSSISPGDSALVQVFAHQEDQAADAAALAGEFDTNAVRRAIRRLAAFVDVGQTLAFELRAPGLIVDEPIQELIWGGRAESVQFEMIAPMEKALSETVCTMIVSTRGVPVGHMKFTLNVDAITAISGPVDSATSVYRNAFLSYASTDRDQVVRYAQLLGAVGIQYFQDVLSLSPGERWERRLQEEIPSSDVFLLFWSSEARNSDWVHREAQMALDAQRSASSPPEIRPVILEGPPAPPPWPELADLHFDDPLLYFRDRS